MDGRLQRWNRSADTPASPHIIPPPPPPPPREHLSSSPPNTGCNIHRSAGPSQPPAKADVPTSSLSSSLKRQTIHYDPSLPVVYSVPIYHRCMDGKSSGLHIEWEETYHRSLGSQHQTKQSAKRVGSNSLRWNAKRMSHISLCFKMSLFLLGFLMFSALFYPVPTIDSAVYQWAVTYRSGARQKREKKKSGDDKSQWKQCLHHLVQLRRNDVAYTLTLILKDLASVFTCLLYECVGLLTALCMCAVIIVIKMRAAQVKLAVS